MKNQNVKMSIRITMIFALCVGAVLTADAAHLKLVSLECRATEDRTFDEAVLKAGSSTFRRTMRDGVVWVLNRRIYFRNDDVISVRLYDEDSGPFDHNDYLGGIVLPSEPTNGNQLFVFNRDAALYVLTYRVEP